MKGVEDMDKKEALEFLKLMQNNDILNLDYKEKIRQVIQFIDIFVQEKTSIPINEDVCIIRNNRFKKGKDYNIYTDGGCDFNPGGKGAYGIVIDDGSDKIELSQGYKATTNNRMELLGPIVALESIPEGSNVKLYSDSTYFCDSINKKWIDGWIKSNWKNMKIKNIDLWQRFLKAYNKHHVEIIWVKGHAGNSNNERCDKLATAAYNKKKSELLEDDGYII